VSRFCKIVRPFYVKCLKLLNCFSHKFMFTPQISNFIKFLYCVYLWHTVRKSISFANTGVTTRATYNGNVRDDRKKDAFLKFQTIFTAPSKHREQTSESYDMVFDQNGIMHDKITIDMTTKKKHWSFQKLMNRLNNN